MSAPRTPRATSSFARELARRSNERARPDGWVFVPYDQLSVRIGPLARAPLGTLGIVLVEAPCKAAQRPYHRQKLALVLANLRHFALEQAARGVPVRHVVSDGTYAEALEPLARELGPLVCMEPAERELRVDLARLVEAGLVRYVAHEGWTTTRAMFQEACGARPPFRMDAFYRHVRRASGVLMERGKPVGGRFSFDGENRQRWDGVPSAPVPPRFEPDAITREVGELVATRYAHHPGELDLASLPATAEDAHTLWTWAKESCSAHFGPYEDAMSTQSSGLFHTRVSAVLNLHRLLPRDLIEDVLALDVPLASKEGFVRQVLGWREFVRHVHLATDGFRVLDFDVPRGREPGDGGYARWKGERWRRAAEFGGDFALPSFLGAGRALPRAYWGAPSGLACLDRVVADVWREGWSHHITRLMVLANVATLLDVAPREITDWFWAAYVDAYDWVVEPNVLAMGTFGAGDAMTTKPYVAGSAYVDRMSDYCGTCAFTPGKDCPLTPLYWAFLARHAERLAGNPRMLLPLRSLAKRAAGARSADARVFERVSAVLAAGERLRAGGDDGGGLFDDVASSRK